MIDKWKVLSVIPARKGSEGLPGKNYKLFCGRPLFYWSLDASVNSSAVDETVVSTNDFKIIDLTDKYNKQYNKDVHIIWRPENICQSDSRSEDALIHAYHNRISEYDIDYDIIVMLQPTSPIRKDGLIDDTLAIMVNNKRNSIMTVSKHTPFFAKASGDNEYNIEWTYDINNRKMRQELSEDEMFFHDDGNLYAIFTNHLVSQNLRFTKDVILYRNDKYSSWQIDDEDDFFIMENIKYTLRDKDILA